MRLGRISACVDTRNAGSPAIQDTYALIVRKLEAAQSGATELERVDIIDDIIDKAVDVYGQRLWSGTDAHTLQLYTRVARLPSTNTRTKLRDEQGLILNEAFHHQPSRSGFSVKYLKKEQMLCI